MKHAQTRTQGALLAGTDKGAREHACRARARAQENRAVGHEQGRKVARAQGCKGAGSRAHRQRHWAVTAVCMHMRAFVRVYVAACVAACVVACVVACVHVPCCLVDQLELVFNQVCISYLRRDEGQTLPKPCRCCPCRRSEALHLEAQAEGPAAVVILDRGGRPARVLQCLHQSTTHAFRHIAPGSRT